MAIFRKKQWPDVFNATCIVAFCTLMGYLCAYGYEFGYLANFGVPLGFIQVTLPLILMVILSFLIICVLSMPLMLTNNIKKEDQNNIIPWFLIIFSFVNSVFFAMGYVVTHNTNLIIISSGMLLFMSLVWSISYLAKQNKYYFALAPLSIFLILLSFLLGSFIGDFSELFWPFPIIRDNGNNFVVVRIYGDQLITMPIDKNGKLKKAVRLMNFNWLTNQQKTIELDTIKIKQ